MAKIKYLNRKEGEKHNISSFPNFHKTGSRSYYRTVYGKDALMVQCGSYIYNVTSSPQIYNAAK